MRETVTVSARGARRWERGHPWIFRSDVTRRASATPGAVSVLDARGRELGCALWSPRSEIALRFLDHDPGVVLDAGWWCGRIESALARRASTARNTNAYRVVFGEADSLPSLICDRYAEWVVLQLLSAGLERFRAEIVEAVQRVLSPRGILARNDVAIRAREGLTQEVELLSGEVPDDVEMQEYGLKYLAAPWNGQKTGAFLDQRENRALVGRLSHGLALDCFSYHGSFALHLARGASHVIALDSSGPALARARRNLELNGIGNAECVEGNVFDYLREAERDGKEFDTIVLDPPAFAKNRAALPGALRGYKEINLRAMRTLATGGVLFTASCSFHLSRDAFMEMLRDAAADSGRRIRLREILGQPEDHPEILGIPETGYLKGAVLMAEEVRTARSERRGQN